MDTPTHFESGDPIVAAAMAGDEGAFAQLVARHRGELRVHCYRMLASFEEAEDVLQETLLRAWTRRDTFDGSSLVRAWLYKIATNACLDVIRQRARRMPAMESFAEIPWLQPYPDRLLEEAAVAKEKIELGFIAIIQSLPPLQRAVLILRDVLDWSAAEVAAALDTSVASANSALQRARATLKERPPTDTVPSPTAAERDLVRRFMVAHESQDASAAIALMSHDVRVTMPPHPFLYEGRDQVASLVSDAFGPRRMGEWRLLPTSANNQPAAVSYLKRPGDSAYRAFKVDVMRTAGGQIVEITTFDARLVAAFGLPAILDT
ncbi:MAG TPA: RNA polymerase subunit sigma-70 [Polyangia bacterium]